MPTCDFCFRPFGPRQDRIEVEKHVIHRTCAMELYTKLLETYTSITVNFDVDADQKAFVKSIRYHRTHRFLGV